MGAGLAGRPPCLPHSQALMGAGLAGRTPASSVTRMWFRLVVQLSAGADPEGVLGGGGHSRNIGLCYKGVEGSQGHF